MILLKRCILIVFIFYIFSNHGCLAGSNLNNGATPAECGLNTDCKKDILNTIYYRPKWAEFKSNGHTKINELISFVIQNNIVSKISGPARDFLDYVYSGITVTERYKIENFCNEGKEKKGDELFSLIAKNKKTKPPVIQHKIAIARNDTSIIYNDIQPKEIQTRVEMAKSQFYYSCLLILRKAQFSSDAEANLHKLFYDWKFEVQEQRIVEWYVDYVKMTLKINHDNLKKGETLDEYCSHRVKDSANEKQASQSRNFFQTIAAEWDLIWKAQTINYCLIRIQNDSANKKQAPPVKDSANEKQASQSRSFLQNLASGWDFWCKTAAVTYAALPYL